jgi:murein DD-endopeptidase MepM/ murein hydrolase activator NlpD
MSFFNRRVGLFLFLDAAILLALIGVFAAVNHAFVPAPKTLSDNILVTPTVEAIPQTLTAPAHKAAGPIVESSASDEFNLAKLRSKTVKVVVHAIAMGENYWTIAKNNNIDIYTLIGANPTMPFKAKIKQSLNLLSRKGVLYTAQKGDDPSKIAALFGIDEKTIKSENGLTWWKGLKEGDILFVPGVKPFLMAKEWKDYFGKRGIFGDPLGRWGRINSPFSFRTDPITGEIRHHNGVDLKAKYGDPVYAAAGGRVTFTGVSGGYGNLIIIASANSFNTYYGHLSKIYAKQGQKVRRGILIGRVGATGRVTGPHLHFEIRKNGKPVDPLLYI